MEIGDPAAGIVYPNLIFGQGEVPEEAPEKNFEEASNPNSFDEDEDNGEAFFGDSNEDTFY